MITFHARLRFISRLGWVKRSNPDFLKDLNDVIKNNPDYFCEGSETYIIFATEKLKNRQLAAVCKGNMVVTFLLCSRNDLNRFEKRGKRVLQVVGLTNI